ncbi:MAG TPA: S66 peptidase family protein [Candidatus Paceibacterota bacterium]|nr:S66 peptidase family protein [Candidatus Paceibacterota bacterium]
MFPEKLNKGDEIRIIAPSQSNSTISKEIADLGKKRLEEMGYKVSFGKYVNEFDEFGSSSIESRISDLHDAFEDKNVKCIMTPRGGFNSNQLLKYINWDIIKNNPKIFCGYSDITALNNAIFTKTGLVNYSGPHYSTFGQKKYYEYTLEYFKKCLETNDSFDIIPSQFWSDDSWWRDQEKRNLIKNEGYWVLNEGTAIGTIIGSNECTFGLLRGTEYFPDLTDTIIFIEDDDTGNDSFIVEFDRNLQALIHQPNFNLVKGIVIGRFNIASNFTKKLLLKVIKSKKELDLIPIIGNVDFGHTDPKITFPIGGTAKLSVTNNDIKITILEH